MNLSQHKANLMSMSLKEVLSYLECSRMTLSKLAKKHNLTITKKGTSNFYIKKEIRKIASSVEENKKFKNKTPAVINPVEKLPADTIDSVQAQELFTSLSEEFYDNKELTQNEQHLLNNLTILKMQAYHISQAILKDPLDEHMQKSMERSIRMEANLVKHIERNKNAEDKW